MLNIFSLTLINHKDYNAEIYLLFMTFYYHKLNVIEWVLDKSDESLIKVTVGGGYK